MSFSLYDATIPIFQQTLGAMQGLLNKVESFCTEAKRPEEDLLQARVSPKTCCRSPTKSASRSPTPSAP